MIFYTDLAPNLEIVEVLTFSGFYTQLLKIAFITAMIIAYLKSNQAALVV